MSLPSLSNKDFQLKRNSHNKTYLSLINPRFKGLTLVLFKSTTCPGCKKFEPDFVNLYHKYKMNGINFATLDVNENPNVAKMSHATELPIIKIPTLILFKDGNVFIHYTGKKNENSVNSFLTKVLYQLSKNSQQLYSSQQKRPTKQGNMPEFNPSQQMDQHRYYEPKLEVPGGVKQNYQDNTFEDDDFNVPEGITPHNKPWENKYKGLEF